MIWQHYNNILNDYLPRLFIQIEVICHYSRKKMNVQMKIDTGSSRTALPFTVLNDEIEAIETATIKCTDYEGVTKEHPIFIVDLKIQGNMIPDCEVVGTSNSFYGLIGRDILSRYMLRCGGPAQKFELDYLR